MVLTINGPDGFVTDDKITAISTDYFSVRNAADSGDVLKINTAHQRRRFDRIIMGFVSATK